MFLSDIAWHLKYHEKTRAITHEMSFFVYRTTYETSYVMSTSIADRDVPWDAELPMGCSITIFPIGCPRRCALVL